MSQFYRRFFILVFAAILATSCEASSDPAVLAGDSIAIEFRVAQEAEKCGMGCNSVSLESAIQGNTTLRVRPSPDLILENTDIIAVVPQKLASFNTDFPEMTIWTGALLLAPEAAERIRSLTDKLTARDRIVVSAGNSPLGLVNARSLGQMMNIGEFSSLDALVEALGRYATVEEGPYAVVQVLTPSQLAARRDLEHDLERSGRSLKEFERLKKLKKEGKITQSELIERMNAFTRGDARR